MIRNYKLVEIDINGKSTYVNISDKGIIYAAPYLLYPYPELKSGYSTIKPVKSFLLQGSNNVYYTGVYNILDNGKYIFNYTNNWINKNKYKR